MWSYQFVQLIETNPLIKNADIPLEPETPCYWSRLRSAPLGTLPSDAEII